MFFSPLNQYVYEDHLSIEYTGFLSDAIIRISNVDPLNFLVQLQLIGELFQAHFSTYLLSLFVQPDEKKVDCLNPMLVSIEIYRNIQN